MPSRIWQFFCPLNGDFLYIALVLKNPYEHRIKLQRMYADQIAAKLNDNTERNHKATKRSNKKTQKTTTIKI